MSLFLKLLPYPIIAIFVSLLSYAVGGESKLIAGYPLIWILNAYCFVVQIIAFIPANIFKTQLFYDLTGSITYLTTVGLALYLNDNLTTKQLIAGTIIAVWAFRLGTFLFTRILEKGFDSRFEPLKKSALRFFFAWFCQGLWTVLTPCPLLILISKSSNSTSETALNTIQILGLSIWLIGFIFEWLADYQKSAFNAKKENKGKFISEGVWSISRHPNYVGEIGLWAGASVYAFSSLHGWEYVSLISPIFVYLLLTKLSGVPLLQKQAQQRWGKDEAYLLYRRQTPVLFPFFKEHNIQSKKK